MTRRLAVAAGMAAVLALPQAAAVANDSIAELRSGGLVFIASEEVAMESEVLRISLDRVEVDYVFVNRGDKAVTAIVAFPMPDLVGSPWEIPAIPDPGAPNWLDFTVTVDGRAVEPELQQRAEVAGIDVTDVLRNAGLPLEPFSERTIAAVADLSDEARGDLTRRGVLVVDTYDDDGTGMKDHFMPYWTLRTTYHWQMTFPQGEETRVSHGYTPSVGRTVGLSFRSAGAFGGDAFEAYRARYCMDDAFLAAVERRIADAGDEGALQEHRISYVLTTGRNWAGPIGRFTLEVDKGDPGNLVSFCADGVEKTGPTTFRARTEDFVPERDLDILVLAPPR